MIDNTLREQIKEIIDGIDIIPEAVLDNATNQLEALLAKEVRKAQLDELLILNHYFERANDSILAESYVTDRIKQLEKEGK